jgi:hypothetical protein
MSDLSPECAPKRTSPKFSTHSRQFSRPLCPVSCTCFECTRSYSKGETKAGMHFSMPCLDDRPRKAFKGRETKFADNVRYPTLNLSIVG